LKHSGNSGGTDCNIEIKPQEITANPGATVNVTYSGNVWSWPGCPACIDQVVVGLEDNPFPCLYHGIPGLYPGQSFSGTLSFTAPQTPGTYRILGIVAMQYTCEDAMEWYRQHPELRFQLGTLTVSGAPPPPAPPKAAVAALPILAPMVFGLALFVPSAYKYKR
jgi:hypothetical protein